MDALAILSPKMLSNEQRSHCGNMKMITVVAEHIYVISVQTALKIEFKNSIQDSVFLAECRTLINAWIYACHKCKYRPTIHTYHLFIIYT